MRLFATLILCLVWLAGATAPAGNAAAETRIDPDLMLSHALSFRLSFAFKPELSTRELDILPPTEISQSNEYAELEPMLWRLLMRGAIVKIGNLKSPTPVVLYYNPIIDVAALTVWQARPKRYDLTAIRLLPGEHLKQSSIETEAIPAWRDASDPFETLTSTTESRLSGFKASYPVSGRKPLKAAPPTRPDRIASQTAAEVRLLTYIAELDSIGRDPSFAKAARAVERAISPDRGLDGSDAAKVLARLPESARNQLNIAHVLKGIDGGSLMLFGFPQNPRHLFFASLSSDKLEAQVEVTGIYAVEVF